jgi:hypothetical protein
MDAILSLQSVYSCDGQKLQPCYQRRDLLLTNRERSASSPYISPKENHNAAMETSQDGHWQK